MPVQGLPVACGPPGLTGGKNMLYRNNGRGTFADVSEPAGITRATGTYGLGVSTLDFDDDGWTDVYVANDSNPSALYRNNHDGTFTDIGIERGCAYSQDGKPQAGMGLALGDYDRNGTIDIFKTNFAGDTSTLYANIGDGLCEDHTFASGIGTNTRWLGWGVGFLDLDLDGWLDLFLVNGHVYPEVAQLRTEAGYKQRKVVYRNLRNGRFEDITERLGAPVVEPRAGRGAAFGDLDNDGDIDVAVNNVHDTPNLYRLDARRRTSWTRARAGRHQIQSQRHRRPRPHRRWRRDAGSRSSRRWQLLLAERLSRSRRPRRGDAMERVEVRWPNGWQEIWRDVPARKIVTLIEGKGDATPRCHKSSALASAAFSCKRCVVLGASGGADARS